MKKRASVLTCVLLAAVLSVSTAACSGNSSSESPSPTTTVSDSKKDSKDSDSKKDESKSDSQKTEDSKTETSADSKPSEESSKTEASGEDASSPEESKTETSDTSKAAETSKSDSSAFSEKPAETSSGTVDPETEKAISEIVDIAKTGPLTQKMAEKAASPRLTVSISGDMGEMGAVSLKIQKDDKGRSRMTMNLSGMDMDVLTTPEATYLINNTAKKYAQTDEEDVKDMAGTMVPGADAVTGTGDSKQDITYLGQTQESLSGKTYTVESYKQVTPESIGSAGAKKAATETIIKLYFQGEDLKYFSATSEGNTSTFAIDEFRTEVSDSAFTLPSGYTKVDNTLEVFMGDMDLSEYSLPSNISLP